MSASDDEEKCNDGREGDVADETGNMNGILGDRRVERKKGGKVVTIPITHEQQQYPFQTITMDLITDLPVSRSYDSILTIVNQGCTKAAVFLPCHKTIDLMGVASLYAQRVFPFYGVLRRVISDRDPRFTAQFVKELCRVLNISQNLSTTYHPCHDIAFLFELTIYLSFFLSCLYDMITKRVIDMTPRITCDLSVA